MNQEKETFFDKNTLIAIFLLGICWIGWDSYMKKKYPRQPRPVAPLKVGEIKPLDSSPEETLPLKAVAGTHEKTHTFSGEKMDLILSSLGMGFREIRLKTFFDRKKQEVMSLKAGRFGPFPPRAA